MAPIFGWPELADIDGLAEPLGGGRGRAPTEAMAHAYDGLDDAERDELAELAGALHEATSG